MHQGRNLPNGSPPLPGTHNFPCRRWSPTPAHLLSGTGVCPAFRSRRQYAAAHPCPAHLHLTALSGLAVERASGNWGSNVTRVVCAAHCPLAVWTEISAGPAAAFGPGITDRHSGDEAMTSAGSPFSLTWFASASLRKRLPQMENGSCRDATAAPRSRPADSPADSHPKARQSMNQSLLQSARCPQRER